MPQLSSQLSSEVGGAAELRVGGKSGTSAARILPEQLGALGGAPSDHLKVRKVCTIPRQGCSKLLRVYRRYA